MRFIVALLVSIAVIAAACSKKEVPAYPPLADYYPLKVGRTYTYRLDSTVRINFGSAMVVHYYLAKDSVESQFNDAQGRPAYRIFRYLRDTLQTQPWTYTATYTATFDNTNRSVEYNDNNLRYIVLKEPVTEGFTWKGNSYIDTRSAASTVKYLDDWNYTYQDINQPYTVRKGKLDSTITVVQVNDVPPPSSFNPTQIFISDYSVEVYAKGVGLVYKEFLHKTWNYFAPVWAWDDYSYGIKLNLVDYR